MSEVELCSFVLLWNSKANLQFSKEISKEITAFHFVKNLLRFLSVVADDHDGAFYQYLKTNFLPLYPPISHYLLDYKIPFDT